MNYLFLPILAFLLFTCNDDDLIEDCNSLTDLGNFDVLESSVENAFKVYDPYERVFFKNEENDTISYSINKDRVSFSGETYCEYKCKRDPSVMSQGRYTGMASTLFLSRDILFQLPDLNTVPGTGGISLTMRANLHLDDPCLGLTGDFVNVVVQPSFDAIDLASALFIPFDLRDYATPFEDFEGFDFFEELVIDGQTHTNVFSSNNEILSNPVKIQMSHSDGIISIEDADGVLWSLAGYE